MSVHELRMRDALRHPDVVGRGLRVGLIVGTILVAINQGGMILDGLMPPVWKIVLTYIVPYCVSSYSSAANMVASARKTS
ncbi:MAG: hypothetical protein Kow00104_00160 [Rhodothalassiaceae bacterium]